MDLSTASTWAPPGDWARFTVIDSHAGGEPFRVVLSGVPPIPGDNMLQRRRFAEQNLDHLRRVLMWEPRGHADMYGGWIGPPIRHNSDISVLFTHNAGFSTMCGHGIIALTKVLLDTGAATLTPPVTKLAIDTPAGQVNATATSRGDVVSRVSFVNVPSFVTELDTVVNVPGLGQVRYDLAFGGAFYAYVDAESVDMDLNDTASLIARGRQIKQTVISAREIHHPEEPDLGFLYGIIFTGKPLREGNRHRSVCVFADGEIDRSPTGTGVSGHLAILRERGEIGLGDVVSIESIVGSEFTGRLVGETTVGAMQAVVPEVSGWAHIVGRSELWVDPSDPLGAGFLLR